MDNKYTTGSEIKARVAKHEESERKIMGDILKVDLSVMKETPTTIHNRLSFSGDDPCPCDQCSLKRYSSVLDGKGYKGLRLKDAQRLMNMSCSEVADKASLNTNPI